MLLKLFTEVMSEVEKQPERAGCQQLPLSLPHQNKYSALSHGSH